MRFVAGRGADKVCCRQRRCGEAVAGKDPSAQRTAGRGAAAKSHREDVAGQGRRGREWEAGTATSSGKASNLPEGMHHREDAAGMGAAAKSHREDVAGRGAAAKSHREAGKEKAPAASKERAPAASKERAPAASKERAPAASRERAPRAGQTKKRAAKPTLLSPL